MAGSVPLLQRTGSEMIAELLLMMSVCGSARGRGGCEVTRMPYGSLEVGGKHAGVHLYTLDNRRVQVDVITYGATVAAFRVPDSEGYLSDIALGFDDLKGYRGPKNQYLGATVGE